MFQVLWSLSFAGIERLYKIKKVNKLNLNKKFGDKNPFSKSVLLHSKIPPLKVRRHRVLFTSTHSKLQKLLLLIVCERHNSVLLLRKYLYHQAQVLDKLFRSTFFKRANLGLFLLIFVLFARQI